MLDPDPPAELWHGATRQPHVATGADCEVPDPRFAQEVGRPVDRPSLDEAGRVERPRCPRVEVAVRLFAQLLTAREGAANLGIRICYRELAAREAADLAVTLVRAERRVDPPQPAEHPLEGVVVDVLVSDVDDDRHTHHVLDMPHTGPRYRRARR